MFLPVTTISLAVTLATVPLLRATTATPESSAALYSIPVAMMGASVLIRVTACRCMLEPISALLASSFSKNGIIAVATETSCLGETSMYSTVSLSVSMISSLYLTSTLLLTNLPSESSCSFAWAIRYSSSRSADR